MSRPDLRPRTTETPGLVVYRCGICWAVGHPASGSLFCDNGYGGRFRRLQDARRGAARLARVVDWTLPEEEIRARSSPVDVYRELRLVELDHFGAVLRAYREHRRLTQVQAARRSGVTKAMLSKYETGQVLPSLPTFYALVVTLGIDLGRWQRSMRSAVYGEPGSFRP